MNKLGNQINSITCYSSAELYWDWISLKCLETLLIQVWVWKCNPRCGLGFLFEETGKCFWEGSNSTPFCNNTAQGEAAPLWMQKNKISASLHPPSTGREKPGNLRASTALSSFFCPNIWLLSHIWILRRWSWLMNHPDWLLNTSLLLSLPSSSFVSFSLNLNHKVLSRPQFPCRFIDVSSRYPSIVLQLLESPEYMYTKYF